MRRFLTIFVLIPVAAVVVILSVANRTPVSFSLDPIGAGSTGWRVTAPLYFFLFAAVALGIVIGGIATWVRQGRWRQSARSERANADRLRGDVARLRDRLEAVQTDHQAPGTAVARLRGRDAA
jgi:uncharacterized integral membrane protein